MSDYGRTVERFTDVAGTLMARDYKGFGQQSMNGVMEKTDG